MSMNTKLLNGLLIKASKSGVEENIRDEICHIKNIYLDIVNRFFTNSSTSLYFPDGFAYVGELYERHVERDICTCPEDFSAMVVFYAIAKVHGWVNDTHIFNAYQLPMAENEFKIACPSSALTDMAMWIITGEESYLARFDNYILDAPDAIELMCLMGMLYEKETNPNYDTVLKKIESSLGTLDIFNNMKMFAILVSYINRITTIDKEFAKAYPLLNIFSKLTKGDVKTKKDLALLAKVGFTDFNIQELSFVIKYYDINYSCSNIKKSRTIVAMLSALATCENKYNDVDKTILNLILEMGELPNKLEGGMVDNVKSILSYYKLYEKVSVENIEDFTIKMLENRLLSISSQVVDFNDPECVEKLNSLPDKYEYDNYTYRIRPHMVANSIELAICKIDTDDTPTEQISTKMQEIIDKAKRLGVNSLEELYIENNKSIFSGCADTGRVFRFLANNGYFNIKTLAEAERVKFFGEWLTQTASPQKLIAMREKEYRIRDLLESDIYNGRRGHSFLLDNASDAENKEYIETILKMALAENLHSFQSIYLNLLLIHSEDLKRIFGETETNQMYHAGLQLAEYLGESYSYSTLSKDTTITRLNETYMSDEEKEAKRLADEAAEKARKEAEKKKFEEGVKKDIAQCLEDYKERMSAAKHIQTPIGCLLYVKKRLYSSSYLKSNNFIDFIKTQLFMPSLLAEDEIEKYFNLVRDLIEERYLTLDDYKMATSQITQIVKEDLMYIKDEEDINDETAECA